MLPPQAPEACASAYSAISAFLVSSAAFCCSLQLTVHIIHPVFLNVNTFFEFFKKNIFFDFFELFQIFLLTIQITFAIIHFVPRKCRNWQTSKTKDLVINAIVWVQVPSSAAKKLLEFSPGAFFCSKTPTGTGQSIWFLSEYKNWLSDLFFNRFCDNQFFHSLCGAYTLSFSLLINTDKYTNSHKRYKYLYLFSDHSFSVLPCLPGK